MPSLSFHPGFSGVAMLAVAGSAMVLVALFYSRAFGSLRGIEWTWLYLLRMLAIVLVVLLLFRPVFSYQRQITERRSLVFLLDNSASMGIADDPVGGTRLEHARSRLLHWLNALKEDFEFHLISFSDSAERMRSVEQLQDVQSEGEATSLSRALEAARKAAPANSTEAVFLLSDGIHNSAGAPLDVASRLGIPVYAVGTGNSLRNRLSYRDVRVTGVECPEQLSVDNRARVQGYVDAVGFPGRVVNVVLEEDDRPVSQQQLVLDDVDGSQEVMFEFTPTVKGLHTYTVNVAATREEKIAQNNRRSTSALVADARIRVLYVEGTLRAEYGALVGRFLSIDPNIEFCALVQTRPNVFLQRTNIEGMQLDGIPSDAEVLDTFDVFVLGDLDSSYLQPEQVDAIARRVRNGAGIIMTGGYHSLGPGGYESTPLDDLLPLRLGPREVGQITDPFLPQLTPEGRRHPIFANIDRFFPTENQDAEFDGLPPLEGCVRVLGAKPAATVLAVHPVETAGDVPLCVMAVQPMGEGRAAAFTGDTTRNWHQVLRTMDRESPFLRFWGQTVRWLAGRSEEVQTEAGISVTLDKAYYEPEAEVAISAIVRGSQGEAAKGARIMATVKGPDDQEVPVLLAPVAGPVGNYQARFEPPTPGRYEVAVEVQLPDTRLNADAMSFDVGRPNLEFDDLNLNDKLLIQIAQATGGRYAHITTADRLVERLQRRMQARKVQVEIPLYWPPLFWLLFVAAITSEWVLRRKYQLR